MSIAINGREQTAIAKHSILSEAMNQNLLNSNEKKKPKNQKATEIQHQNLNKVI